MKNAPWIVAAVIASLYLLAMEREAMDDEADVWRAERDSVIAEGHRMADRAALAEAKMDSLKAHTDSIVATFEPETVTVVRWVRYMQYAPIGTVQDSLMTP